MSTDSLNQFLDFVGTEIDLDEETKVLISQYCRLVKIGKGELLLNIGEVCKDVYYIIEGRGISYFTDFNGKATTWFFHFNRPGAPVKNLFAVDYRSFLSNDPSAMSIQALTEITAIHFTKREVGLLVEQSTLFESWIRKLNEKSLIMAYDRIATLLVFSATERYQKFLTDEPYLLDMFSNYHIATYLNVTPQSLSRIRTRLIKAGSDPDRREKHNLQASRKHLLP